MPGHAGHDRLKRSSRRFAPQADVRENVSHNDVNKRHRPPEDFGSREGRGPTEWGGSSGGLCLLLSSDNVLPTVERHAGSLHADLSAYVCENFLVCLTSVLSLACDKVEVGCGVVEYLIYKVHDELHILLYETA